MHLRDGFLNGLETFQAIRGHKWNHAMSGRVRGWLRKVNLAVEVWNLTPKEPSK
jgi:hypothetical protein